MNFSIELNLIVLSYFTKLVKEHGFTIQPSETHHDHWHVVFV